MRCECSTCLVWSLVVSLFGLGGCSDDTPAKRALADGCVVNSECAAGLVCTFQRCHEECATSRDCPSDARCVESDEGTKVCQLEVEKSCEKTADCEKPLACGEDGQCRNDCSGGVSCLGEQVCSIDAVCAEPDELDDNQRLLAAGGSGGESNPPEAGAGSGGDDEGKGGTTTEGGSSGSPNGGNSGVGGEEAGGGNSGLGGDSAMGGVSGSSQGGAPSDGGGAGREEGGTLSVGGEAGQHAAGTAGEGVSGAPSEGGSAGVTEGGTAGEGGSGGADGGTSGAPEEGGSAGLGLGGVAGESAGGTIETNGGEAGLGGGSTTIPTGCAAITGTPYFCDDFESGLSNWVVSGQDWNTTNTTARSGDYSITDSPDGDYAAGANAAITLAASVDLSAATVVNPILTFWYKLELTEAYLTYADYAYVEASSDGGTSWDELVQWHYGSNTSTWSLVQLSLSSYVGERVKVRFRLADNVDTAQADGWYIDDVVIQEAN